jgi:hypothetical protein
VDITVEEIMEEETMEGEGKEDIGDINSQATM